MPFYESTGGTAIVKVGKAELAVAAGTGPDSVIGMDMDLREIGPGEYVDFNVIQGALRQITPEEARARCATNPSPEPDQESNTDEPEARVPSVRRNRKSLSREEE